MPVRYTPPRATDLLPVPGVMLGTAFCFDMGYDRPRAVIESKAAGLNRKDQDRVVRDNAARLLRLR